MTGDESWSTRLIGEQSGSKPGPTVWVTAGIHGNEPAGIEACRRVLAGLAGQGLLERGRLVAVKGNTRALARGRRFLAHDLNRAWTLRELKKLLAPDRGALGAEDLEQYALLDLLREEVHRARGPLIHLDLHSTSAGGAPFVVMGDTLRNRQLAFRLHLPVILGLEEALDGTLIEFVSEHGHCSLAVEGGQSGALATVRILAGVLWTLLKVAGCLRDHQIPDEEQQVGFLKQAARKKPQVVEILYRRPVTVDEVFEMEERFKNFDRVCKGEQLGRTAAGPVLAPMTGLLLLPLKQPVGSDAFFIGMAVGPLRRLIARLARQLGLHRLVSLLPGVYRDPDRPETLLVVPRIARFLVRPVFMMLGYHRCRARGPFLVFSRRRPDRLGPKPFPAPAAPKLSDSRDSWRV